MTTKHFFFAILGATIFSACSVPESDIDSNEAVQASLFSDPDFRAIHDVKNGRETGTLIEYLRHPEARLRAEAALAMGSVQDTTALPELVAATQDSEPEVRLMAAFALGQFGHPRSAPALISLIENDTTTTVRTEALESLGKCGGTMASTFLLDYVPRYLFDEAGHAWGLYRLTLKGEADERHLAQVGRLLQSPYEESRLAAAFFCIRYRDIIQAENISQLMHLAEQDPVNEVRSAATRALGIHGTPSLSANLGGLILKEAYPGVRLAAINAIAAIAPNKGRDTIWQGIFDGNPNVALTAARRFGEHLTDENFQKAHQQAIAHPLTSVRVALYQSLLRRDQKAEWVEEVLHEFHSGELPQEKALWLQPLTSVAAQYSFLDSLVINGGPVVSTAALQVLHQQFKIDAPGCDAFNSLFSQIMNRSDFGQMAYFCTMIRDEELGLSHCIEQPQRLIEAMNSLPLPEALEAWIELNQTYSKLKGGPPLERPNLNYEPINWGRLALLEPNPTATVVTTKGSFEMVLLPQDAPATVSYFLQLLEEGYYNNKTIHRVVPNFVIQTGCPRGDGYGAPGSVIRSEFSPLHYGPGVIGMASAGKDTESSQWFVTHRTTPHLDGRYTIFAAIVGGMDVIWQLEQGDRIQSIEFMLRDEPTP